MTKMILENETKAKDLQENIYNELIEYGKSNEIYFDILINIIGVKGERKVDRELLVFRRFMKGMKPRLKEISMELGFFFERELSLQENDDLEIYITIKPCLE